jgi:hypothetical protein
MNRLGAVRQAGFGRGFRQVGERGCGRATLRGGWAVIAAVCTMGLALAQAPTPTAKPAPPPLASPDAPKPVSA